MRWIVASLAFINIAAFIYFQVFSDSPEEAALQVTAALPAGAETIRLLGEPVNPSSGVVSSPPFRSQPAKPKKNSPPPVVSVKKPKQAVCTIVGAFDKLLKAEYFVERLAALGLQAEVKELVVASKPGYWLHLKPELSRKEALRRLSELQRRGIDSYVIPSGDLANGISLGMFSQQDSAVGLQEKIRQHGQRRSTND